MIQQHILLIEITKRENFLRYKYLSRSFGKPSYHHENSRQISFNKYVSHYFHNDLYHVSGIYIYIYIYIYG